MRTHRKATSSVATDASTAEPMIIDRHPPPAASVQEEEVRDVRADGDQFAVREVDEVHDAEDHRDAQRKQRVRAADTQTVDDGSAAAWSGPAPRCR